VDEVLKESVCICVWQVDVFIPGHHTHGSIVVRRAWDKQGMEVIEHLIEKVSRQMGFYEA
jgi:hypothetical protein